MASTAQSDQFSLKHPKPPFEGERKLLAGVYVDYNDEADVISNTNVAYRKNKYYWIDGILYQVDSDGTTFRPVAGGGGTGLRGLKFAINADGSGTPDQTFDGYKAVGTSISDPKLVNVKILVFVLNGIILQDFIPTGINFLNYIPGTGTTDYSVSGPTEVGNYIIIIYQPQ